MSKITEDFKLFGTGEKAGATSATQLSAGQACKTVLIKAKGDNAGNVYIGASGVTVPNEVADTTAGYPLDAGEELRLFVGNLSQVYFICDFTGDALSFLWQG